MMITLSEWARKVGVSRERANVWLKEGRIVVIRPCKRVVLIEKNHKRPVKLEPWHKRHETMSVYNK